MQVGFSNHFQIVKFYPRRTFSHGSQDRLEILKYNIWGIWSPTLHTSACISRAAHFTEKEKTVRGPDNMACTEINLG